MFTPFRTLRDEYLHVWRHSLNVLLGWSEEDVSRWASRYQEFLVPEDNAMFYHEPPAYYFVDALISDRLLRSLETPEIVSLEDKLQDAIENGDSFWSRDPKYDWEAAKERVDRVLKEYGESLESMRTDKR